MCTCPDAVTLVLCHLEVARHKLEVIGSQGSCCLVLSRFLAEMIPF